MPRPSPGQQIINGALVRLFADTTPGSAAEVAYEALQEEVDELSVEVRALRQKLDAKSLVECRIPHPSRTYFGLGLLSRAGLGLGLVFILI